MSLKNQNRDLKYRIDRWILNSRKRDKIWDQQKSKDINATGVRERYRHGKIRVEKIALEHSKL